MRASSAVQPRVQARGFPRAVATLLAATVWLTAFGPGAAERVRAVSVLVHAANPFAARDAVARHHGTVTHDLPIVDSVSATVPAAELPALEHEAGIAVTPDAAVHVQADLTPTRTATAVFPAVIGADALVQHGVDASGITVAVVDTGISKVRDLGSRVIGGVDYSGEGNPYADNYGHGTFVAGVLAGNGASSNGVYHGVAPGASLLSVKVAGADGSTNLTKVISGINWVVRTKAYYGTRVLNLSLGTDATQSYLFNPLNQAVEKAWKAGIVVIVAASNEGPAPGTISKPGDDPFVVTAGALDDDGTVSRADDVIASFSGRGPTLADGIAKPDLVAPGRSLISLRVPGSTIDRDNPSARIGTAYFKGSGTSFSAAATSGAVALMLDQNPSLVPDLVKSRLAGTAVDGLSGGNLAVGSGSLDVLGAVGSTITTLANIGLQLSLGALPALPASVVSILQGGSGSGLIGSLVGTQLDASQWDGSQWAASQWSASQWAAFRWAASQWAASQWGASQWAASQWAASQWSGSQWAASQWAASQWAASQWSASQWSASQWAASQWAASQWAASQWSASQWAASQWSASQWSGSTWL